MARSPIAIGVDLQISIGAIAVVEIRVAISGQVPGEALQSSKMPSGEFVEGAREVGSDVRNVVYDRIGDETREANPRRYAGWSSGANTGSPFLRCDRTERRS